MQQRTPFARKLLILLLTVAAVLFVAHISLKYISVVGYEEKHGFLFELSNRLDMNDENSVPQWVTQTIFLSIALGGGLASYLAQKKEERRFWAVIAVGGVLLSLDDAATLHEFILQTIHNTFFVDTAPTFFRNAWFILLPFVLVIFLWACVKMIKLLPRRTIALSIAAGFVYVLGAVFVDSITNDYPLRSFAAQGVLGGIEGVLQIIGSSLFLYAIVGYMEEFHSKRIAAAVQSLKRS